MPLQKLMATMGDHHSADVDVEEIAGILELPITGWIIHPRMDSVRLVGFVNRGTIDAPRREPTIILHVPMSGFMRSVARMAQRWHGMSATAH